MKDPKKKTVLLYKKHEGILATRPKTKLRSPKDLAQFYFPGINLLAEKLKEKPELEERIHSRSHSYAIITTLPTKYFHLIESKAALLSEFTGHNFFPILVHQPSPNEFIHTLQGISSSFAGILFSDVRPDCMELLKSDTSITLPTVSAQWSYTAHIAAAAINAVKLLRTSPKTATVVLEGESEILVRLALLLRELKFENIIPVDEEGLLTPKRPNMNRQKIQLSNILKTKADKRTHDEIIENCTLYITSNTNILSAPLQNKLKGKVVILTNAQTPCKLKSITVAGSHPQQDNHLCDLLVAGALLLSGKSNTKDSLLTYSRSAQALASLSKSITKKKLVLQLLHKNSIQKLAAKL